MTASAQAPGATGKAAVTVVDEAKASRRDAMNQEPESGSKGRNAEPRSSTTQAASARARPARSESASSRSEKLTAPSVSSARSG